MMNQKGVTLTSVLIGMGLLGILSLGLSTMMTQAFRAQRMFEHSQGANQSQFYLQSILSNNLTCEQTGIVGQFVSPAAPSTDPNISLSFPGGEGFLTVGQAGNDGWTPTSSGMISHQDITPGGCPSGLSNTCYFFSNFQIEFKKTDANAMGAVVDQIGHRFFLRTSGKNGSGRVKIQACGGTLDHVQNEDKGQGVKDIVRKVNQFQANLPTGTLILPDYTFLAPPDSTVRITFTVSVETDEAFQWNGINIRLNGASVPGGRALNWVGGPAGVKSTNMTVSTVFVTPSAPSAQQVTITFDNSNGTSRIPPKMGVMVATIYEKDSWDSGLN